jgi:hypothetical protein
VFLILCTDKINNNTNIELLISYVNLSKGNYTDNHFDLPFCLAGIVRPPYLPALRIFTFKPIFYDKPGTLLTIDFCNLRS